MGKLRKGDEKMRKIINLLSIIIPALIFNFSFAFAFVSDGVFTDIDSEIVILSDAIEKGNQGRSQREGAREYALGRYDGRVDEGHHTGWFSPDFSQSERMPDPREPFNNELVDKNINVKFGGIIPEPATLTLISLGLLGAYFNKRKLF